MILDIARCIMMVDAKYLNNVAENRQFIKNMIFVTLVPWLGEKINVFPNFCLNDTRLFCIAYISKFNFFTSPLQT